MISRFSSSTLGYLFPSIDFCVDHRVNHQACGGYAMDDIRLLHRMSTQGDQPF